MYQRSNRIHTIITVSMVLVAILAGLLAWLSLSAGILYSPIGNLEIGDKDPSFYIGISIYITTGVTLFTSALIRIGLRISR